MVLQLFRVLLHRLNRNILCVRVEKLSVDALIETGSDISIISEQFQRRLDAEIVPWGGGIVRGADNTIFRIQPTGEYVLQVVIGDETFCVSAVVFSQSGHDLKDH